jgi:hypothetical protein
LANGNHILHKFYSNFHQTKYLAIIHLLFLPFYLAISALLFSRQIFFGNFLFLMKNAHCCKNKPCSKLNILGKQLPQLLFSVQVFDLGYLDIPQIMGRRVRVHYKGIQKCARTTLGPTLNTQKRCNGGTMSAISWKIMLTSLLISLATGSALVKHLWLLIRVLVGPPTMMAPQINQSQLNEHLSTTEKHTALRGLSNYCIKEDWVQ